MTTPLTLNEKLRLGNTALVVVDYQNDFIARGGAFDKAGMFSEPLADIHDEIVDTIGIARDAGAKVLFLRCSYNAPDEPFLSEAFLDQVAVKLKGLYTEIPVCVEGTWGADFYGDVRPEPGDLVVSKHRFGAFVGTDMDLVLRTNNIRTLVYAGAVTHVCVESTVREAFFHNYFNVIVRDAVAGWQDRWHETSLEVMDFHFGQVVEKAELAAAWTPR